MRPNGLISGVKSSGFNLRIDVDETATVFAFGEDNHTVNESVDGMILAHAYVEAGMMYSTTLTLDDIARFSALTAKNLNTESFAFSLAAVLRTTYTFLMCHFLLRFRGVKQFL